MLAATSYSHLWILLAALVMLAVALWAVVDIARSPWLKTADRIVWLLIVIVLPLVGAAAWLLMRGSLSTREE